MSSTRLCVASGSTADPARIPAGGELASTMGHAGGRGELLGDRRERLKALHVASDQRILAGYPNHWNGKSKPKPSRSRSNTIAKMNRKVPDRNSDHSRRIDDTADDDVPVCHGSSSLPAAWPARRLIAEQDYPGSPASGNEQKLALPAAEARREPDPLTIGPARDRTSGHGLVLDRADDRGEQRATRAAGNDLRDDPADLRWVGGAGSRSGRARRRRAAVASRAAPASTHAPRPGPQPAPFLPTPCLGAARGAPCAMPGAPRPAPAHKDRVHAIAFIGPPPPE